MINLTPILADLPGNPAMRHFADNTAWTAIGLQTASTVLVTIVSLSLNRVIARRFLRYWAMSWVCLAIGLLALNFAYRFPERSPTLYSCYWVAGNMFGFLLFAGCRAYVFNRRVHRADIWIFAVPAFLGLVLPYFYRDITQLLPIQSLFLGGYCLLSLIQTIQFRGREGQTLIGLRLLQISLSGMLWLFWHYSIVWGAISFGAGLEPPVYLRYSSLIDAYLELALAFAQVVLATDSVRRELASTNRQLALATEHLALAARTDALTGLLNRRAFDAMLNDAASAPGPGCLCVVDLNDLKRLNDQHGHAVGDSALRVVAKALQAKSRLGDPVFRLGGDEFLVILSGVPPEELTRRLTDVDESLLKTRLPELGEPIDLMIAWGVAEFGSSDLTAAVERADAAMYACKSQRKASRAMYDTP